MVKQHMDILTRAEFENILEVKKVTIIKASATWCGPCKKIIDFVKNLFEQMSENVQIVYLDVDEGSELADFMRVKKLPTFISYVGLDRMDILEGAEEEKIKKFFMKCELQARFLYKM